MTALLTSILAGLEQHSAQIRAALQARQTNEAPVIIVPPGGRRLLAIAVQVGVPYINYMYRRIGSGKKAYICEVDGFKIIEAQHFTPPQFVAPGCKPIVFEFDCSPDQYLAALAELVK